MAAVTICSDFGAPPQKKISVTVSIVSPSICHEVMELDAMIFAFWMLSFKPTFSLSSFTFIKRLYSSSLLSTIRVLSPAYLRLVIDISPDNLDSSLCFIQPGISHDVLCFPQWLSGKESACQCRTCQRPGFSPCIGKFPWRKKWQPTPIFLPGKIPWTEEPGRLQSMGPQKSRARLSD